jgi:hypothetical protein
MPQNGGVGADRPKRNKVFNFYLSPIQWSEPEADLSTPGRFNEPTSGPIKNCFLPLLSARSRDVSRELENIGSRQPDQRD